MKVLIVALFALIVVQHQPAAFTDHVRPVPDSIRVILDSSISLVRKFALHRDLPDWEAARKELYELAADAHRPEDLGPAISRLFEIVNDYHGWLAVNDTMLHWARPEQPYLNPGVRAGFAMGNRIVRSNLPGHIGYLKVPGMIADTSQHIRLTRQLADSLCALRRDGATSYIIDLRLNAGGTMYPMIDGLHALLGGGELLGNADSRGDIIDMVDFNGYECEILPASTRVVVLTGHGTGSAGECTAVAFKGRRHTTFIGEPTAGYTTANDGHWIEEGKVGIVIAGAVIADRNKRMYPHGLIPDIWVPGGDNFVNLGKDAKIIAAVRHLRRK